MKTSTTILAVQLELRPSRIHLQGVGVFAVRDIGEGGKIADGVAEEDFESLISWSAYRNYGSEVQDKVMAFCVGTPEGFLPPPDNNFDKLSIEWYLNHSCDGDCGFDSEGDFIARRDIRKGEEIAYDYALIESNPNFSMRCDCGSEQCRRVITGNDWKNEDFISRNRPFMHPRLRRLLPVAV